MDQFVGQNLDHNMVGRTQNLLTKTWMYGVLVTSMGMLMMGQLVHAKSDNQFATCNSLAPPPTNLVTATPRSELRGWHEKGKEKKHKS